MIPNVPELQTEVIDDLRELDHKTPDKTDRDQAVNGASGSLKQNTARGAVFSSGAQAVSFVLRTLSMVILARLLFPKDFGLLGMVTAATGFIGLFRDAGLSLATVQRDDLTKGHVYTLFWVNFAVGCLLAGLSALAAPVLVIFYHEPRLFWITVTLGLAFIFQGASAQHRAILQRNMRFRALAIIDTVSSAGSIVLAISMATTGWGYWALVAMTLGQTVLSSCGTWLVEAWKPGAPGPLADIVAMLRFGGAISLNSVLSYLAYNTDKILLGRFWGAQVLGIYGRAYQLANLPVDNLNSTLALVAFPALSRLQNEPVRLRNYFLNGYRLFLSLSVPLTVSFALFGDDIILVFLGPRWHEAAPVFRLLAPTITAFGLINPLFWLLLATGQVKRSLKMGMAIAPLIICGYAFGLSRGPNGVAASFSLTMILLAAPLILFWAQHGPKGTVVKWKDMLRSTMPPLLSAVVAALATLAIKGFFERLAPPILRLGVATSFFFAFYLLVLLFAMKQRPLFQSFLHEIGLWPLPRFRVRVIWSFYIRHRSK
jgi:O-antigen/teichoic acid export membrane protein